MRRNFHAATDRIWFTSDLHFGHKAMLKHCNRPFKDVDEMDRVLIQNWNDWVEDKDHVFVLGDLSFRSNTDTLAILGELKGTKYLIRGNHDHRLSSTVLSMFDGGVADYHEIDVDNQRIVLCHFAFRSWNRMHYGSWNLHGHSHGNLEPFGKQLDVGVDAYAFLEDLTTYCPNSYDDVKAILEARAIRSEDHHQPKEGT